jgi:phosphoenolpyruvate-protein kinase (PTS system EI component)
MANKLTLEDLDEKLTKIQEEIAAVRSELRDDLRHVRKDILAIHSDLIKHDERMDQIIDAIHGRPETRQVHVE